MLWYIENTDNTFSVLQRPVHPKFFLDFDLWNHSTQVLRLICIPQLGKISFLFVCLFVCLFVYNVQATFLLVQNDIIFFKVRISSRIILEGPNGLKFGNDDMFKGVASGQLSCIHLNVYLLIKCFFQYFSSANSKRNIRVMNQLNPICAFVLVVIKHLSSV